MKRILSVLIVASLLVVHAVAQPASTVTEPHDAATKPTSRPTTQRADRKYQIRYTLSDGHENWPADKKAAIVKAMDEAVALYNELGEFDKQLRVSYSPGTPTADANWNGHIRFGGQIGTRTALHEICHTLGVGTTREWRDGLKDGVWQGLNGTSLVRAFDGPDASLKGDRQHFWPYGLNYDRDEDSPRNRIRHVMMVAALRKDMGFENGAIAR